MSRSKLTASSRQELIRLFKETSETITGLSERFGVSISTARRVLKTEIPASEYEEIVSNRLEGRQSKRSEYSSLGEIYGGESHGGKMPQTMQGFDALGGHAGVVLFENVSSENVSSNVRKPGAIAPPQKRLSRRRRSSGIHKATSLAASSDGVLQTPTPVEDALEKDDFAAIRYHDAPIGSSNPSRGENRVNNDQSFSNAMEVGKYPVMSVTVLPIQEANLPQQCYLVIDRSAELITRPLKDFSELGDVPAGEDQLKILPIFDNHKIASRFSHKNQRIIKIPNSKMLQQAYSQLNAKGIERILFDGQVFSLSMP